MVLVPHYEARLYLTLGSADRSTHSPTAGLTVVTAARLEMQRPQQLSPVARGVGSRRCHKNRESSNHVSSHSFSATVATTKLLLVRLFNTMWRTFLSLNTFDERLQLPSYCVSQVVSAPTLAVGYFLWYLRGLAFPLVGDRQSLCCLDWAPQPLSAMDQQRFGFSPESTRV